MRKMYQKPDVLSESRLEQTSLACTVIPDLIFTEGCYEDVNPWHESEIGCNIVLTKGNTWGSGPDAGNCDGGDATPVPEPICDQYVEAQQFS